MVCIYCSHLSDARPGWRGDINHSVCYTLVTGRGAHAGESGAAQGRERTGQEKQPVAGCREMWDSAAPCYLMPYLLTASHDSRCNLPCYHPMLVPTASIYLPVVTCPYPGSKVSGAVANCKLSLCEKCHCGSAVPHEVQADCVSGLPPHLSHVLVEAQVRDGFAFGTITSQHLQFKHWLMR